MTINCPKCDADISDTYEGADYECGINPGWYCAACDLGIGEHEIEREPLDGDVPIMSAKEFLGDRPLGTPISELHGRPEFPGDPKYAEFCRIAKTWGYD